MRGDIEMTFEKYEKAEMEIIEFEAEDVITMSGIGEEDGQSLCYEEEDGL